MVIIIVWLHIGTGLDRQLNQVAYQKSDIRHKFGNSLGLLSI